MNKKYIMQKIADEYNQYSKAKSFYSATGNIKAQSECQVSVNTIHDIVRSLELRDYNVILVDDQIMDLQFKWYKMVTY